jgi:hypothetical protein
MRANYAKPLGKGVYRPIGRNRATGRDSFALAARVSRPRLCVLEPPYLFASPGFPAGWRPPR